MAGRTASLVVLGLLLWGSANALGQERVLRSGEEILFRADSLEHDRRLGIVTARGHVEIVQGRRILRADLVSYNQKADLLTATGNIALMPAGEIRPDAGR